MNVDRPRVTKEASVITRDQLDHKGLHEGKHLNIGSSDKVEMISDFVSLKDGANMVEKDNLTQVLFLFFFCTAVIIVNHYSLHEECKRKGNKKEIKP